MTEKCVCNGCKYKAKVYFSYRTVPYCAKTEEYIKSDYIGCEYKESIEKDKEEKE